MQLELFEDNSELALMQREINDMRESQNKVRRAIFMRANEIQNQLFFMREELKEMKRELNIGTEKILELELWA